MHDRRALTVTQPPFPLGRASLGDQDFQHGPDPHPLLRTIKIRSVPWSVCSLSDCQTCHCPCYRIYPEAGAAQYTPIPQTSPCRSGFYPVLGERPFHVEAAADKVLVTRFRSSEISRCARTTVSHPKPLMYNASIISAGIANDFNAMSVLFSSNPCRVVY
jgi:hypothetical protein